MIEFKKSINLLIFFLGINLVSAFVFFDFDVRTDHPWRNTDMEAEIKNYSNGTPFIQPTVDISRNKYGSAFLEVPLPIFQYLSGKLAIFFKPSEDPFRNFGPIQLQIKTPLSEVDNIEQFSQKIDGIKFHGIEFEYFKSPITNLIDSSRIDVFYSALNGDCKNSLLVVNGKTILNNCETLIKSINLKEGKNIILFHPSNEKTKLVIYSMSDLATIYLTGGRVLSLLLASLLMVFIYKIVHRSANFDLEIFLSIAGSTMIGYFFVTLHEELLASTIAFFVVLKTLNISEYSEDYELFKKLFYLSILIGISTAIRPYYFLFSLYFLIPLSHKSIRDVKFKSSIFYLIGCCVGLLMPSIIWYKYTQSRVSLGADTIEIFNNRVYFDSLLDLKKWKQIIMHIFNGHFQITTIILMIIVVLILAFSPKLLKMTKSSKKLIYISFFISVIIFPLVFDSASVHNYYIYPVTILLNLIFLIVLNQIAIDHRFWKYFLATLVVTLSLLSIYFACKVNR